MIKFSIRSIYIVILLAALLMPLHSQQVSPFILVPQMATGSDPDDTDVDLSNPPCPVKFAHPISTTPIMHYSLPMPKDATARKRYLQAQNLQNTGFAYLAYGRYGKAIARLQQSLALWPDSADTYRWLAETYEAEGQTKEAIANYRLLFYGWPGRIRSGLPEQSDDKVPADKPRDYDQVSPAETDPTLLMRFSLLLQQTNQDAEARQAYDVGMQMLTKKFADKGELLPPVSDAQLTDPKSLEAATQTALAIDEASYQNYKEAVSNVDQALQLWPDFAAAQFHRDKILKAQP